MIEIENLAANVDGSPILKGLSVKINPGEIHAVMGPNGTGKSTLAKVIAGHPAYDVTGGRLLFDGEDLLELEAEDRAHKGVFISFQYPIEVPGVSNKQFLMAAYNANRVANGEEAVSDEAFDQLLDEKMEMLGIAKEFKERNLNEGFSGGEKKRNEILQLAVLGPKFAVLDETDSGLDIDALKMVAEGVNQLMNPEMGLLMITHYQRLLNYIKPDYVHVMLDGKIVRSGDASLALELEEKGYDWLMAEVS